MSNSAFSIHNGMVRVRLRLLLALFALAQAILYSSLMPLWEGFDEPWHYGYVQQLSTTGRPPVLGQTRLSREVWNSVHAVPVSHVVQHAWPELQTFDAYFALAPADRAIERHTLESLPRDRSTPSGQTNYEAQQAPLAYAVLAVPDLLLRQCSLPVRILWLRIFNALLAIALLLFGADFLFRTLGLNRAHRDLALFCLLACQMLWAAVAHVSSDGIALALAAWCFGALAAFAREPSPRRSVHLALATALGLLAKAYFLPLAVLAAIVVMWRRARSLAPFTAIVAVLAGPWCLRNVLLYRNLSGLLMADSGNSPRQVLAALGTVHWSRTLPYMLRATLWTGNNSFTNFSTVWLNALLALLFAGLVFYALRWRAIDRAEWSVLAAIATFSAAVIYVVGNDVLFLHGESAGASPWYTIPLLAPVLAFSVRDMPRPLAIALSTLWVYLAIATYVVKLIPLYGGYPAGRATLRDLFYWYTHRGGALSGMLRTIALAPPWAIYFETALVVALAIVLAVRLHRPSPRDI